MSKCGTDFSRIMVRMGPTLRLTIFMPGWSFSSSLRASQYASSANLVLEYAIRIGKTTLPRMLEHWTTLPTLPWFLKILTQRLVRSTQPKKLHSKISLRSPVGTSSAAPPTPYAPLLKSASRVPPVASRTSFSPLSIVSPLL